MHEVKSRDIGLRFCMKRQASRFLTGLQPFFSAAQVRLLMQQHLTTNLHVGPVTWHDAFAHHLPLLFPSSPVHLRREGRHEGSHNRIYPSTAGREVYAHFFAVTLTNF